MSDSNSPTVLVVDDELFFREILKKMLADSGFKVVSEACDGAEAVQKYSETKPALVLMDIYMSAISGIEATKEIMAINPSAKIIICSGTGYDDDIAAALAAGAKAVIFKPFYDEEVLETLRNVLAS
ncbi:MAG: response regulator [Geobacteraceae bacterium]|nr:response regulator [Geobacteraceae bacterium]